MNALVLTCLQAPSASGEYPVILFAVSVATAYVVTPGRDYPADDPSQPARRGFSKFYSDDPTVSIAIMPRYNAHFVPVKYCGRMHCVTGKPLPLDTDYQAAVEGMDASEFCCACFALFFCESVVVTRCVLQLRTRWWRFLRIRRCRWLSCG